MIGEKIKSLRKSFGMTQEQLAARLRVEYGLKTDRATVGKWEVELQTPEMYTLACLAKLFEVSLDTFSDSAPLPSGDNETPRNLVKIAGRDGSYVERNLTDEQLALFKGFLDQLPEADDDRL